MVVREVATSNKVPSYWLTRYDRHCSVFGFYRFQYALVGT